MSGFPSGAFVSGGAIAIEAEHLEVGVSLLVGGGDGSQPARRFINPAVYLNGYQAWADANMPGYVAGGFCAIYIHNPWGHTVITDPFEGDQALICRDHADINLANLYFEFGAAFVPYRYSLEVIAYIGNFYDAVQTTTDWTALGDVAWAARVADSIAPVLEAHAILGQDVGGLTPVGRAANHLASLSRRPLLEPWIRPGYSHLLNYSEVIAQNYLALTEAEYVPTGRHKRAELYTGVQTRDEACKWLWQTVRIKHRRGFFPSHLMNAGDTVDALLARGSEIYGT